MNFLNIKSILKVTQITSKPKLHTTVQKFGVMIIIIFLIN